MAQNPDESRQVVKNFPEDVRSGKNPQNTFLYLADTVNVHEVTGDMPGNFITTPDKMKNGILERTKSYGNLTLEVKKIITEGEKVYVRWEEQGKDIGDINGYEPTGADIVTLESCVYLVRNKKIVEYWIQVDYLGSISSWKRQKTKRPPVVLPFQPSLIQHILVT